ncbi:MAG: hypothetical protein IT305_13865 [Chloroflexi bacterium]|nr:hypothetical protein [Chloroflexota bacterium]
MSVRGMLTAGFAVVGALAHVGGSAALYLALGPTLPEPAQAHLAAALVIGNLILVPLVALAGWVLAWLAFEPVRDVTRTAAKILHTGRLDGRCFYRGPRDEVGNLVVVMNETLTRLDVAIGTIERLRPTSTASESANGSASGSSNGQPDYPDDAVFRLGLLPREDEPPARRV